MKKSSFVALLLGTVSGVFFCFGYVHGYDSGVELFPARRSFGMCRPCVGPRHHLGMAKNGA